MNQMLNTVLLSSQDRAAAFRFAADSDDPPASKWDSPQAEELNALIPDIEIQWLLGRGGMGAVYRGRQINLNRDIAVKLLPVELASDPTFEARFRREAKAMAELDHPNIVRVYDFGHTTTGQPYYTMELVEGVDLRHVVQSGHLCETEALEVVEQICEALHYSHGRGYVHRDIKPANVFLGRNGEVKIGDFGLAKLVDAPTADFGLTQTGVAVGTPGYSAPEQFSQPGKVDHRADIYSLGAMLYEMLTGEVPRGNFPPPSERAHIDSRLDDVVLRALESDRNLRFQQASEIGDAVKHIQQVQASHTTRLTDTLNRVPFWNKVYGVWERNKPLVCLVMLVAIVGLAGFLFRGSPQPTAQPAPAVAQPAPNPPLPPVDPLDADVRARWAANLDALVDEAKWKDLDARAKLVTATRAKKPRVWLEGEELVRLLKAPKEFGADLEFDRLGFRFGPGHYDLRKLEDLIFDLGTESGVGRVFRDVTFLGAGMDKTLIRVQDLSPRCSIDRLHFEGLTVDSLGDGLIDLRGAKRTLTASAKNARFIGFDMGHGGSTVFSAEARTVIVAEDCEFLGGYGAQDWSKGSGRVLCLKSEFSGKLTPPPVIALFNRCLVAGLTGRPDTLRMPAGVGSHTEFLECRLESTPYNRSRAEHGEKAATLSIVAGQVGKDFKMPERHKFGGEVAKLIKALRGPSNTKKD